MRVIFLIGLDVLSKRPCQGRVREVSGGDWRLQGVNMNERVVAFFDLDKTVISVN